MRTSAAELIDKLRHQFGNKCQECGAKRRYNKWGVINLEFAHIKSTGLNGRGRGLWKRIYDIKNHPECYKLLCWRCHREFDLMRLLYPTPP